MKHEVVFNPLLIYIKPKVFRSVSEQPGCTDAFGMLSLLLLFVIVFRPGSNLTYFALNRAARGCKNTSKFTQDAIHNLYAPKLTRIRTVLISKAYFWKWDIHETYLAAHIWKNIRIIYPTGDRL